MASSISTAKRQAMVNDGESYCQKLTFDLKGKLRKYYCQRYKLFSRYDEGIQLDEESWWSVTPENIAIHHAERFQKLLRNRPAVILDGFCGAGGNTIQFARSSPNLIVIGCDISPEKIQMAKHNAKVYGVDSQCQFILGNFMNIIQGLRAVTIDAVFLSPPWGGTEYTSHEKYSLNSMTPNGYSIIDTCRKYLSNNLAFLLPRNVDMDELRKEVLNHNHRTLEFEQNMVMKKVKTITVYLGELINESDTEEDDEDSSQIS